MHMALPIHSVPQATDRYPVIVRSMTLLAEGVLAVEFIGRGVELPLFGAGSHIDLVLPNGICRSYSLCNPPSERGRYVVGVKRANPSRGASAYVHDALRVGQTILVGAPRNNFPLAPQPALSIFIAGGIGITPIWSMIQKLEADGAEWRLYYAVRTRADAAFLAELQALGRKHPGWLDIRFDHEPGTQMLDLGAIVSRHAGLGAHFYGCGPTPMLDAFEAATAALPAPQRHLERFTAELKEVAADALAEFEVVLAKCGSTVYVRPKASILDTLLDAGVEIPFSCMEGVCGSCKVNVLEGMPDHRDSVLSDDERARNDVMLVCCSGSRSRRLVLDL